MTQNKNNSTKREQPINKKLVVLISSGSLGGWPIIFLNWIPRSLLRVCRRNLT